MYVPFFFAKTKRGGDTNMQKYSDLYSLLESDGEARQYFETLPAYVQETISERADGVNSFESLCNYVDKLTRGDN